MIDNSVIYIQNLKSNALENIQFSENGKYLAVIVNDIEQDSINLYKISDWKLSRVSRYKLFYLFDLKYI